MEVRNGGEAVHCWISAEMGNGGGVGRLEVSTELKSGP